ncbi:MAG: amidohydrolase, partial [Thermoguttaceae bacterium]|nr:amidohydrolase [Thermoguttaceae bacterium]
MAPTVVEWRRYLHAHPELSNREEQTSRYVAERLREIGVDEIKTGVARHGIVALIRGGKPGGAVALRADMDALPIQEQTGLAFASQNPGVMHACGHDAHTAILLGAAKALVAVRADLPGTVKLLFQPAEEGAPRGEEGGAGLMIKEGALANPDVEAIFGLHVSTDLPAGKLAYRDGVLLASVDRFRVKIAGKQSHAAMPWQGIDPIVATAQVITALQTIASRKIDAREAVV